MRGIHESTGNRERYIRYKLVKVKIKLIILRLSLTEIGHSYDMQKEILHDFK